MKYDIVNARGQVCIPDLSLSEGLDILEVLQHAATDQYALRATVDSLIEAYSGVERRGKE